MSFSITEGNWIRNKSLRLKYGPLKFAENPENRDSKILVRPWFFACPSPTAGAATFGGVLFIKEKNMKKGRDFNFAVWGMESMSYVKIILKTFDITYNKIRK